MGIYLTAITKSNKTNTALLRQLLLKLVTASTKEEACLQYDLHQSTENPDTFIFHEHWADRNGLQAHQQEAHFVEFLKDSASLTDGPFIIYETEKIS